MSISIKKPSPPKRPRKPTRPNELRIRGKRNYAKWNLSNWGPTTLNKTQKQKLAKALEDPLAQITIHRSDAMIISLPHRDQQAESRLEYAQAEYEKKMNEWENREEIHKQNMKQYELDLKAWKQHEKIAKITQLRKELRDLGGL